LNIKYIVHLFFICCKKLVDSYKYVNERCVSVQFGVFFSESEQPSIERKTLLHGVGR